MAAVWPDVACQKIYFPSRKEWRPTCDTGNFNVTSCVEYGKQT